MKRGRPSSAALALVGPAGVEAIPRPRPPSELTPAQADEWVRVVNRMPADWFPAETHGLLAQYCRHRVASERVALLVRLCEEGDEFDVNEYDRLLKMQEREGRAISSLATKMRLSQQSTYDRTKRKPVQNRKPWEES